MSSGRKAKPVIVSYWYSLGVHLLVCHGEVDEVKEIIIGERQAWLGSVTSNSTISINNLGLFGGRDREGGVQGSVDMEFGGSEQARNAYLSNFQGGNCPAYRGLFGLIFRSFTWSAGNPYFKSPWVRVKRILKGWNNTGGVAWYSSRAVINSLDMNPAHIVYQCLTDNKWGMGYSPADIDNTSFMAAADTLYNEGFGLSLLWHQQKQINEFIQSVLNHVNGMLALDMATGKFVLKLIRDDYNVENLLGLDETNIIELKSFERATYGDMVNEIVVTYSDRDDNEKTVAVQDLASIQAQGGVISASRVYMGIRDDNIAARVAMRDLALVSSPLAKLSLTTNRVLWNKNVGDVVRFSWEDFKISNAAFRIIDIKKGTLLDGRIQVELVEDVFGLPSSSYTSGGGTEWGDPIQAPVPLTATRAIEASYFDVRMSLSNADFSVLEPGYGFGMYLAARVASNNAFGYTLYESASAGGTYAEVSGASFSPTGTLITDITRTQTTFTLANLLDANSILLDTPNNGRAVINNEYMAVVSVNTANGSVTVRRGVLDTIPVAHAAGSRMYFINDLTGYDPIERTNGETVYYKACPRTGLGILPIGSASAVSLTFTNRASKPYPPGKFQIGGSYWPTEVDGETVNLTWAHRDRVQQTVSLVDYTAGNIGPEAGSTYTIKVYNGAVLKQTYSGLTGTSWSYPTTDQKAHGPLTTPRFTLETVVAGVSSMQNHDHTVTRHGCGFDFGLNFGK